MASSQRQVRAAAGVSRILTKLKTNLDTGNFYEAHQLYRTLYFRYSGQGKFSDAEDLLYDGAIELFNHGQVGSGIDLTKLYIEVLGKRQETEQRTDSELEKAFLRIVRLYANIPRENTDNDIVKATAIRWASSSEYPSGHPRLHQLFAHNLWSLKRYPESRNNFLFSCDGSGCGKMLVEFHTTRGFPREIDLFITSTVLQFLVLRKHIVAAWALKVYTENHPSIKRGPPFKHPLLNFVWLLLLAIEHKKNIAAFSSLVELYKPSLQRDPSYFEYIDKIGQHFFGLPPPQQPRGMLSGLIDSLMSAMNENEDESNASISMDAQDLD